MITAVFVVCGSLAIGLLAMTASTRYLLLALGFFLPVQRVVGVDPLILDGVRYGLCGIIVARGLMHRMSSTVVLRTYEVLIFLLATVCLAQVIGRSEDAQILPMVIMLVSLVAVAMLGRTGFDLVPLLKGYVVAASVNGAVIAAQAVGVRVPLVDRGFVGFERNVGFGANAPLTSYELAIALVFTLSLVASKRRLLGQLAILAGLVFCGGRGGLLAAVLAITVVILTNSKARKSLLSFAILGCVGVVYLVRGGSQSLGTVNRIMESSSDDLSSGRVDLFFEAASSIGENPIVGVGVTDFAARFGAEPHNSAMYFGVSGGLLGFAAALWLTLLFLRHCFPSRRRPPLVQALAVVIFVWSMVEPSGPFVGMTGMLCLLLVEQGSGARNHSPLDLGKDAAPQVADKYSPC